MEATEATLLQRIHEALPEEARERIRALRARRHTVELAPAEHAELLRLIEAAEQLDAARVRALVHLARLLGEPLRTIMDDLGLQPPAVEGLD